MQNKFLDKREKMDGEEDNIDIIFMNSFNTADAFTALQMEIYSVDQLQ